MTNYVEEFFNHARVKADRLMNFFLTGYFAIGLALAFYHNTWFVATGVGGALLAVYYAAKYFLKKSHVYQYVLSAVVGIFMAQFIYQMHGMFEMHFFAFIGSAILIIYRNWKLQIPLAIVVIIHHACFGYLGFLGFDKIYYAEMGQMSLETFLIHITLALSIFLVCGLWAKNFKQSGTNNMIKSYEIGKLQEANKQKDTLVAMAEHLRLSNMQLKRAHAELQNIFNSVEELLFSMEIPSGRMIQISRACRSVYGFTEEEFLLDNNLWYKVVHLEDRYIVKRMIERMKFGKPVNSQFRVVSNKNKIHWIEIKLTPTFHDNKMVRVDGVCNDVTGRIQLERKLADEKRLQHQQLTAAVINAKEREFSFIGEELHEKINPILATARLYLDCAITEGERSIPFVKDSKGFITTAMNEIRKLSKTLIPPSLSELGLIYSIVDMIEILKPVTDLEFVTNWKDFNENGLTDKIKLNIYRILQEQLSNVVKHAQANVVCISLRQDGSNIELCIQDDGIGFDLSQKRNGAGLHTIASRCEMFNGNATINTEPGKGFNLFVKLCETPVLDSAPLEKNKRA